MCMFLICVCIHVRMCVYICFFLMCVCEHESMCVYKSCTSAFLYDYQFWPACRIFHLLDKCMVDFNVCVHYC